MLSTDIYDKLNILRSAFNLYNKMIELIDRIES